MRSPRWTSRWWFVALAACALVAMAVAGVALWVRSPAHGLPYRDRFAAGTADEWKALGGTWELVNGTMRNESDERGAKLLTGSRHWQNYSVEADVSLLGSSGDAGLIIRSGDEEEGVNAYSGYYAGVRMSDNSLVLGRAQHGWMEATKQLPASDSIRSFHWYHLKLLAWNCHIVASVSGASRAPETSIGIHDEHCIASGRIGLRSYSSGGVWRNVVVRPATREDMTAMLAITGNSGNAAPRNAFVENPDSAPGTKTGNPGSSRTAPNAQSIASLRLISAAHPVTASVRGVVILTQPRVYVEDSTGGVYVPNPRGPLLKVGDEVEVSGEVHPGDYSSTLEHATVHVLWARTPVPPLSVTVSQASTGSYDATFIEVRGRLTGKERGPGSTLVLDVRDGPQALRAILNPGRADSLFSRLKTDSTVRLRGICVVDPALTHNLTPFVLLLRSNEDLDIIAGPPWWNTRHVIAIAVSVLLLTLVGVVFYHRVENWRLRAILEERGRLAHEMHDTLAQSFAGIGFQLQAIQNGLPQEMPGLHQQLQLASNLVRHSHEEARRSIASLRTEKLQPGEMLSALESCARRMVEGGSVQVTTEIYGDPRPVPLRITDALYRIGQEAIANAVSHGGPAMLMIRLRWTRNAVALEIEDNGSGFVPGGGPPGFGIRGMRRRAQSVAAQFHLNSEPGKGTCVTVEAALPPRLTFLSWPGYLWKNAREYWIHARPARTVGSHSYRG